MRLQRLDCRMLILFVIMAFLAVPIFPQIPKVEDKWWKDPNIRAELQLTSRQVQQLDEVMGEFRGQLVTLTKELQAKWKERENLLRASNNIDIDAYRTITNQIYGLRVELDRVHLTFRIKLGKVLTPQQRILLNKIQSPKKSPTH